MAEHNSDYSDPAKAVYDRRLQELTDVLLTLEERKA